MIPFTWYNIDGNNNSFIFNDGTNRTISLTNGVYSQSSLVSELQNKLNNSASTITFNVTFNNISKKLIITGSSTFLLDFTNINQTTHKILGFDRTTYATSTSHTSVNVININENNSYVNVYSKALTKFAHYTKTSNKIDCFIRVPNAYNTWGSYILYENIKDQSIEFNPGSTLSYIDFTFEDNNNKELNFNGVSDILINLKTYSKI